MARPLVQARRLTPSGSVAWMGRSSSAPGAGGGGARACHLRRLAHRLALRPLWPLPCGACDRHSRPIVPFYGRREQTVNLSAAWVSTRVISGVRAMTRTGGRAPFQGSPSARSRGMVAVTPPRVRPVSAPAAWAAPGRHRRQDRAHRASDSDRHWREERRIGGEEALDQPLHRDRHARADDEGRHNRGYRRHPLRAVRGRMLPVSWRTLVSASTSSRTTTRPDAVHCPATGISETR